MGFCVSTAAAAAVATLQHHVVASARITRNKLWQYAQAAAVDNVYSINERQFSYATTRGLTNVLYYIYLA